MSTESAPKIESLLPPPPDAEAIARRLSTELAEHLPGPGSFEVFVVSALSTLLAEHLSSLHAGAAAGLAGLRALDAPRAAHGRPGQVLVRFRPRRAGKAAVLAPGTELRDEDSATVGVLRASFQLGAHPRRRLLRTGGGGVIDCTAATAGQVAPTVRSWRRAGQELVLEATIGVGLSGHRLVGTVGLAAGDWPAEVRRGDGWRPLAPGASLGEATALRVRVDPAQAWMAALASPGSVTDRHGRALSGLERIPHGGGVLLRGAELELALATGGALVFLPPLFAGKVGPGISVDAAWWYAGSPRSDRPALRLQGDQLQVPGPADRQAQGVLLRPGQAPLPPQGWHPAFRLALDRHELLEEGLRLSLGEVGASEAPTPLRAGPDGWTPELASWGLSVVPRDDGWRLFLPEPGGPFSLALGGVLGGVAAEDSAGRPISVETASVGPWTVVSGERLPPGGLSLCWRSEEAVVPHVVTGVALLDAVVPVSVGPWKVGARGRRWHLDVGRGPLVAGEALVARLDGEPVAICLVGVDAPPVGGRRAVVIDGVAGLLHLVGPEPRPGALLEVEGLVRQATGGRGALSPRGAGQDDLVAERLFPELLATSGEVATPVDTAPAPPQGTGLRIGSRR